MLANYIDFQLNPIYHMSCILSVPYHPDHLQQLSPITYVSDALLCLPPGPAGEKQITIIRPLPQLIPTVAPEITNKPGRYSEGSQSRFCPRHVIHDRSE